MILLSARRSGQPQAGPDTTPPTVSVTAPSGGATLTGVVTLSATASDNVGVVGVQFKLDGANIGAEDLTAPYSISWNSALAGNGAHTITAVARDAAGNSTTSAGVSVTTSNSGTGLSISRNTLVPRMTHGNLEPAFPGDIYMKHARWVYNPNTGKGMLTGGDIGGRHTSWNVVMAYNVATDTWDNPPPMSQAQSDAAGQPFGACVPAACYANGALWRHGGEYRDISAYPSAPFTSMIRNGLWCLLDGATTWIKQGPTTDADCAPPRSAYQVGETNFMYHDYVYNVLMGAAQHPTYGSLLVSYQLATVTTGDGVIRDLWGAPGWSVALPFDSPLWGSDNNNLYAVDTLRRRLIFYVANHGTWAFDFTARTFSQLSTQLLAPETNFGMQYDEEADCVIMFGGGYDIAPFTVTGDVVAGNPNITNISNVTYLHGGDAQYMSGIGLATSPRTSIISMSGTSAVVHPLPTATNVGVTITIDEHVQIQTWHVFTLKNNDIPGVSANVWRRANLAGTLGDSVSTNLTIPSTHAQFYRDPVNKVHVIYAYCPVLLRLDLSTLSHSTPAGPGERQ